MRIGTIYSLDEEGLLLSVSIYQNPNHGIFVIELSGSNISSLEVRLIDLSGKLLEQHFFNMPGKKIDFSPQLSLTNGVYFIQILSDRGQDVIKLIVAGED
ncbi:MAG: T9SS type A sorting domain-containing protein [Chitinophagales bacterium]